MQYNCFTAKKPDARSEAYVMWFRADYRQGARPNVHHQDTASFLRLMNSTHDKDKIYWRKSRKNEKGIYP